MRQSNMACFNDEKINKFLSCSETGYLGLFDGVYPYVVPMNFIWHEGAAYFHGADEGKKIDIMKHNNRASLTVSESFGTIADPVPARTDTAYMSVMIFGEIIFLQDLEEATAVMQHMLNKYVPGYYETPLQKSHVDKYRSSLGSKTVIYKLLPQNITAKENPMNKEKSFFPGRTIHSDK
ncbi:pyridoxamine 5'-phosphate oxidase family protein [Bacillus sp. MUM 13]|uniref:pyridoxamine 5'-phosphate oxidase family protein n=1 Tax=Bacillus sp. MUM 13 TaxID=1678001 RepID=UPI0008F5F716|nr:pyridoxamine 5'-phosphate oxidase family protein [Bacillus sp. MUM 13]OIK11700.1 pyridoxamine 5-phosphate oxidase [Bacillus sp. MUM 13]